MKKNIISILLVVLLALAAPATFTSCVTTPSGAKGIDPAKATQLAPPLRTTVSAGVVYAYMKDKNSVAYADVIKAAIQEFVLSADLSPSALQAKINALPIKELKTAEAQLVITPLLAAYKAYGQQYVAAGLADQQGWKILAQALVDGIDDSLQGISHIGK